MPPSELAQVGNCDALPPHSVSACISPALGLCDRNAMLAHVGKEYLSIGCPCPSEADVNVQNLRAWMGPTLVLNWIETRKQSWKPLTGMSLSLIPRSLPWRLLLSLPLPWLGGHSQMGGAQSNYHSTLLGEDVGIFHTYSQTSNPWFWVGMVVGAFQCWLVSSCPRDQGISTLMTTTTNPSCKRAWVTGKLDTNN